MLPAVGLSLAMITVSYTIESLLISKSTQHAKDFHLEIKSVSNAVCLKMKWLLRWKVIDTEGYQDHIQYRSLLWFLRFMSLLRRRTQHSFTIGTAWSKYGQTDNGRVHT